MPNHDMRGVFETQFIADDGIAKYDDGTLGCEAMIGELTINLRRLRYETISVKTARL